MSVLEIDGQSFETSSEFHRILRNCDAFPSFYGENLSALQDALGGLVARPFKIIWKNSHLSRERMGDQFDKIVKIMRDIENHDIELGWIDRFELEVV